MRIQQLRHVADVRVSNVDKKSVEGQEQVRLVNYVDVYYRDQIDGNMELMAATATREQINSFGLAAGDSVITKDSETAEDIAIPAFIGSSSPEMVCGYHLAMLRPNLELVDPRLLFWALKSSALRDQLAVRANGVTRYGLTYEAILGATIRLGSLGEQRRIADFLDGQVVRIDNIIAAREKQSRLLDLAWQGGLDSILAGNDDRQPRLARFARVQTGVTVDAGRKVNDGAVVPYLRVANVQAGSLALAEIKEIELDRAQLARCTLQDGDVLMTEGGDIDKLGRGTVWRSQIAGQVAHQNHVFAVRVDQNSLLPEFLASVTSSTPARRYFELTATKTTNLASTSASKVLDLRIPYVSIERQCDAVDELDRLTSEISELRSGIVGSSILLSELKRSLITAAVTGEFDVTTADGSRVPV